MQRSHFGWCGEDGAEGNVSCTPQVPRTISAPPHSGVPLNSLMPIRGQDLLREETHM
jgi:hypothetical protein